MVLSSVAGVKTGLGIETRFSVAVAGSPLGTPRAQIAPFRCALRPPLDRSGSRRVSRVATETRPERFVRRLDFSATFLRSASDDPSVINRVRPSSVSAIHPGHTHTFHPAPRNHGNQP